MTVIAMALGISVVAFAQEGSRVMPTVNGTEATPHGIAGARNPSIVYHGGPVMGTVSGQPVHLYYIFYGGWSNLDPGGPQIMTDFANNLGGSGYWNILTSYVEPNGASIKNALTLAGTTTDNYSQGKTLSDTTLQTVVKTAISNGSLPLDANGIYHVLTSQDVTESGGFCTSYCGFHSHMSYNGQDVKYTFVGNPVYCVSQGGVADCQGESTNVSHSPNNDPGVDAMISIIAHESEEATSDPDLNAWYFRSGNENGDQCAYKYGSTFAVGNGSVANVTLGGRNFLIQEDWIAPAVGCALSH